MLTCQTLLGQSVQPRGRIPEESCALDRASMVSQQDFGVPKLKPRQTLDVFQLRWQ